MKERLLSLLDEIRIAFAPPPDWAQKIVIHHEELEKWNRVNNLTAHNAEEYIYKDVADSLIAADMINLSSSHDTPTVLDVGSGSGVPGLLMAALLPDCFFTLAEPRKKRVSFLKTAKVKMGLKNVKFIPKRLSEKDTFSFDICTGRAALTPEKMIELAPHWLNEKGEILLMLGAKDTMNYDEIISDAVKTGLYFAGMRETNLKDYPKRSLIMLSKVDI